MMRTFKNATGRIFEVVINVASLRRVKDSLGVDLWRAFEDEARILTDLLGDPITFTQAVYLLVGGAAGDEAAEGEFCRGIDGDTLDRMQRAFTEELIDFFPPPRRPLLRRMFQKGEELSQSLQEQASRQIDRLTPESVLQVMGPKLRPGVSPVSSGSTPAPSPSGN
jgi:hypothetical protein